MADNADTTVPANLLNARRLYKASTSVIIDWLIANGTVERRAVQQSKKRRRKISKPQIKGGAAVITINDITSYADRISNKQLIAPPYIKERDGRHQQHEYFTETLAQAFNTLFTEGIKVLDDTISAEPDVAKELFVNSFGPCQDLPTEKASTLSEVELQQSVEIWTEKNTKPQSRIADDPTEEVFKWDKYLMEMDHVMATLKSYWQLAARGKMSVYLTAWLTSVGFHGISKMCDNYRIMAGLSQEELLQNFIQVLEQNSMMSAGLRKGSSQHKAAITDDKHVSQCKEFSQGLGLVKPIQVLMEWKFEKQMDIEGNLEVHRASPFDFFIPPGQEAIENLTYNYASTLVISKPKLTDLPKDEQDKLRPVADKLLERDQKCLDFIIRTTVQTFNLWADDTKISSLTMNLHNPMLMEVNHSLRAEFEGIDPNKINEDNAGDFLRQPQTETIFGLMLLVETSKSYFYVGNERNPINIRRRAVALATEVKKHMQRLVEGEVEAEEFCNMQPDTVHALDRKCKQLDWYIHSPGTDLYHQMPWTAGAQSREILNSAMELGMRVCRSRDILGQALHAYNVVRKVAFKLSHPIPLMEQLCELFEDQIFIGDRPKKKFRICLRRFAGGKLTRMEGTSDNGRDKRKHKFVVGAPNAFKDGEPGNDRSKVHELSFFNEIYNMPTAFYGGSEFWVRALTNRRVKTATKKQILAMDRELQDVLFAEPLEQLKEVVTPEFEGPFPVAKINCFHIDELAVEILTEVARRYQSKFPAEMYELFRDCVQPPPADAAAGSSFLLMAMEHVDMMVGNRRSWIGDESDAIQLLWESLRKCVDGKKVEDFFWKNV